jgi:hypothetical protein
MVPAAGGASASHTVTFWNSVRTFALLTHTEQASALRDGRADVANVANAVGKLLRYLTIIQWGITPNRRRGRLAGRRADPRRRAGSRVRPSCVGCPTSPGRVPSKPRCRFLDQRQHRWLRRHPPPEPGGPPRGHSNKRERQNPRSATPVDNFRPRVRVKGTLVRGPGVSWLDRNLGDGSLPAAGMARRPAVAGCGAGRMGS